MACTYEALKGKTIAQLRDIAQELHHEALQGYTQMNKEHLLPAICAALGIDTHQHLHRHHRGAAFLDKAAAKATIRALRAERDTLIATGDHSQLSVLRQQIHTLKHKTRIAAG